MKHSYSRTIHCAKMIQIAIFCIIYYILRDYIQKDAKQKSFLRNWTCKLIFSRTYFYSFVEKYICSNLQHTLTSCRSSLANSNSLAVKPCSSCERQYNVSTMNSKHTIILGGTLSFISNVIGRDILIALSTGKQNMARRPKHPYWNTIHILKTGDDPKPTTIFNSLASKKVQKDLWQLHTGSKKLKHYLKNDLLQTLNEIMLH